LDVIYFGCRYRLCITWIIHQQLWGYKVQEKLYLGIREQKMLNTTGLDTVLKALRSNPLKMALMFQCSIILLHTFFLQCNFIWGMLQVNRDIYRDVNMKMYGNFKTQPALGVRLTDARRMAFCALILTHVEAFHFSADTIASVTLGVADRYHSTCVYLVQSTPNQGGPYLLLHIPLWFPSKF
jgi:hypothetical protein